MWTGISVYDALECYVEKGFIQHSAIQTIYDHKLAMLRRVRLLQELELVKVGEEGFVLFEQAVQKALILRNILLKYKITGTATCGETLKRLMNTIHNYKKHDQELMERFLFMMNKHRS